MRTLDKILEQEGVFEKVRVVFATKYRRFVLYKTPFLFVFQLEWTKEGFFLTLPFFYLHWFSSWMAKELRKSMEILDAKLHR